MTALGRVVVIANPASGGGRVGRSLARIHRAIASRIGACELVSTSRTGDGERFAREAVRSGANAVLSLGGDGTHHDVLQGLLAEGSTDVAFGPLPAGTGNDFCRVLEGGRDLRRRLRALGSSRQRIDVIEARFSPDRGGPKARFVLNVASAGLSGEVDVAVAKRKTLGGALGFFVATVETLARFDPTPVRITVDGRDEGEVTPFVIAACNGRFAGGGMAFGPQARLADGCIDVVVIEARPLLGATRLIPALYRGGLAGQRGVRTFRARSLRIEPAGGQPTRVDVDGESPGVLPLDLTVAPRAIDVLGACAWAL